jgi:hypothetical protein
MNNKTGVIGVNHLNTLLVRLATQCDLDNPQKNTAHSKRKYAITSLTTAKEDLGIANIKVAARHKSDDAHRQCQQGAPFLHDRCIRAMWAANGGANEIEGKCLGAIEIACFACYIIHNDFRTYVADAADERRPAAVDDRLTPQRAASRQEVRQFRESPSSSQHFLEDSRYLHSRRPPPKNYHTQDNYRDDDRRPSPCDRRSSYDDRRRSSYDR